MAAPLMLAGSAVGALGALQSGYAQAGQYNAQAGAAAYNRDLARQNADTVSAQANAREEQIRREGRQTLGAQRGAIAESGTGFTGSNLDIMQQDAANLALDALNARYEGALSRTSYENEAAGQEYQRKAAKKAAGNAKIAGWIGAGSSLLSGSGNYLKAGGKIPSFGFGN